MSGTMKCLLVVIAIAVAFAAGWLGREWSGASVEVVSTDRVPVPTIIRSWPSGRFEVYRNFGQELIASQPAAADVSPTLSYLEGRPVTPKNVAVSVGWWVLLGLAVVLGLLVLQRREMRHSQQPPSAPPSPPASPPPTT